ncbi:MAG: carboxypeptidase-like regulatory domain-containing protein [Cytophagia bacterium]|nr:carboxypeptidase-like regulatory domain-containing protein [Cytophagia bacterium]
MKKALLIFVFIPCLVNAQLLKGVLLDKSSSEPIPFATIGTIGSTSGTVSNINGEFLLETAGSDSIIVSHLNYGVNYFKIDLNNTTQTYRLTPLVITLAEVTITGKTIQQILNEAVLKSEQAVTSPIYLKSYYREFVKTNNNYTKFSDGIVNYYLENKGKGNLKTKVWVTDSRAVELYDEKEEKIDWDLTSPLDIQDGPKPSLISSIGKFLNEEEQGKYDFKISSPDSKDKNWTVISVLPKKEIEEMLFEATIAIDDETGLILQLDYHISDYHKQFAKEANLLIIKAKLLHSWIRIHFNESNGNYNIAYVYRDASMKVWNKSNINTEFRFTSDLIVTDILPNPNSLLKEDLYSGKSLYKRKTPTKTEFWINSNAIKLTEDQQQIVDGLMKANAPGKQ